MVDGLGTTATFNGPLGLGIDVNGNVFVADNNFNAVRKINPVGSVTTFAGSLLSGIFDGVGTNAQFSAVSGMLMASTGLMYVTDGHRIRSIDSTGRVTSLYGSTYGHSDGLYTSAQFYNPTGLFLGSMGNLLVADKSNHIIRQVDVTTGQVTTIAGLWVATSTSRFADGAASSAMFYNPNDVVADSTGNVFIADASNHKIRMISSQTVSTLGTSYGFADGSFSSAKFNYPTGLAIDTSGNVFVSDQNNNKIRKITPSLLVTTIAGSSAGVSDGVGTSALFYSPMNVKIDSAGNLYITENKNFVVRKISFAGNSNIATVTTLAGAAVIDGVATSANLNGPSGIGVSTSGVIYFTEQTSHRLRKLVSGSVTTVVGAGYFVGGFADGATSSARFNSPMGIDIDTIGNLYIADQNNHRIRKLSANGQTVSTFAGSGTAACRNNNTATLAQFSYPNDVLIANDGGIYVADRYNHAIRYINSAQQVTTFAGSCPGVSGLRNGTGTNAKFSYPQGVAMDTSGEIYVGDTSNDKIRKINPAAYVSTYAGFSGASVDGSLMVAKFNGPAGLTVNTAGNVFIADSVNNKIRVITSAGNVRTLAGNGVQTFADGSNATASFYNPQDVALDSNGDVIVADMYNHKIRKITVGNQLLCYLYG